MVKLACAPDAGKMFRWKVRRATHKEVAPPQVLAETRAKLGALIGV